MRRRGICPIIGSFVAQGSESLVGRLALVVVVMLRQATDRMWEWLLPVRYAPLEDREQDGMVEADPVKDRLGSDPALDEDRVEAKRRMRTLLCVCGSGLVLMALGGVSALSLAAGHHEPKVSEEYPEQENHIGISWVSPPGQGVNLGDLNQCLEKAVRHYHFKETGLEEKFPGVPVMGSHVFNDGLYWLQGPKVPWGSSTTWAVSPSKHLAYLINQKVGCTSLRWQVAYCEKESEIPCDLLNSARRPWKPEDAGMNFRPGGNFFSNMISPTSGNPSQDMTWVKFQPGFLEAKKDTMAFTFVIDPMSKFIGGYRQLIRYKTGTTSAYTQDFIKFAQSMTAEVRDKQVRYDTHFAPQLAHLYQAAIESSQIASQAAGQLVFEPPFQFVGRMDHSLSSEDWKGLINVLENRYPEAVKFVNPSMVESNGFANGTAPDLHGATAARMRRWERLAKAASDALGEYGHAATMPRDLARRFCAAFYADFVCFGIRFPEQCVDPITGEYDVTEFPKHIVQFDS